MGVEAWDMALVMWLVGSRRRCDCDHTSLSLVLGFLRDPGVAWRSRDIEAILLAFMG
jgi:hypothetical protein